MKEIYLVILPDKNTHKYLKSIKTRYNKKYDLKITNHPLHITLRSSFVVKDYDVFLKHLIRFSKKCSPFVLVSDKYEIFNKKTLVLLFKKEKYLLNIEKDIVKLCEKHMFFEKPFKKYEDKLSQIYYNKYRDIYVLERYNPHMTIFYNLFDNNINLNKIKSDFSFVCNSFAVVEKIKSKDTTLHVIIDTINF